MRPRRLAALVAITTMLLALLPAVGSAGHADLQLVPPAGQTAVKGGDTVTVQGTTTEADADVRDETLLARDAAGVVLASYDIDGVVTSDGETLSGSIVLGCGVIPGCADGDGELRGSVAGYQLAAHVGSGSEQVVSQVIEFDEVAPLVTGYFLIGDDGASSNQIEVRFSEDVADPDGDSAGDWTVEGVRASAISGEGDRRVLTAIGVFGPDDTPNVRYDPQRSLVPDLPNEPYVDEAGNTLRAKNRFADAADRIAPAPPTIDAINGTATTRDDDQAVPVLGSDPRPTITVGGMTEGHTARVWLDEDDDGNLDDGDTFFGEAVADSAGEAQVALRADLADLADGTHRLFARALDGADCDPNDSSSDPCPNASGRSQDALYDLDRVAPALVSPALASGTAVTVKLSEPVTGPDTAADWAITNSNGTAGPDVTGISGSGDTRVLQAAGVEPGATLAYAATSDPYSDEHGNELDGRPVPIDAQEFPVVRLVDATGEEQDGPDGIVEENLTYEENTVDIGVELSEPARADETVTVTMEVVEHTATAGDDCDAAGVDFIDPGPVVTRAFSGGETSGTVSVQLCGDTIDEVDETFELRVSGVENAAVNGDETAVGTIIDDDAPVALSVADVTANEGDGTAAVTVSIDAASGKPVSAEWSLRAGSATPGQDYEDTTGTLTIPAGETSTSVPVTILPDDLHEAGETFELVLDESTNATIDRDAGHDAGTVTIEDDDPAPSLRISDLETFEGDDTRKEQLVVTLSEVSGRDVTVGWVTADGTATAGSDYTAGSGTVTIPAGATSDRLEVEILGDEDGESDEQFTVVLENEVNATIDKGTGTVTLLDDDGGDGGVDRPDITVTVTGGEVGEGDAVLPLLFPAEVPWTITLSEAADGPIRVQYRTTDDGTATMGEDFEEAGGTVEIPAGETTAEVTADVIDDDLYEGDETVALLLEDPVGAALVDDAGAEVSQLTEMATILDDEQPDNQGPDGEAPVLTIEGGSVDESDVGLLGSADPGLGLQAASAGPIRNADGGDAPAMVAAAVSPLEQDLPFTVTLAEPAGQDATVRWTTTTLGTATAGSDYTAVSGTLTIPEGDTEGEVAVDVHLDDLDEFDETVIVRFLDAQGAQFPDGAESVEVAGTIIDDDAPVTVELGSDVEVTEGQPATFEVTLSATGGKDIELRYWTSDGSATAGQDYRATDDTLTIPAGDDARTFTVTTLDDSLPEDPEDAEIRLDVVDEGTAQLGRSVGTLTIADNDDLDIDPDAIVVSLAGAVVEEGDPVTPLPLPLGGNSLDFEVRLSEPADGDVVIQYATRAGTATAGEDFEPASGEVTIPADQQQATISVAVVADFTDEFDEDLQLVLTDVSGDAVLPGGEVARTGRILDDDPQAQVRVADATVMEGDVAELDVTLDNASDKDITVAWALVDGSATAGQDYVADNGTLSFPAGTTALTVQATTLADDDTAELIEQFEFVLSDAANAGIDDGRGTVSIIDIGADGLPTTTAVFLEDITTREGSDDGTALVPVRLTGARDEDTTLTWSTQQLSATEGEDYRAEGGQVVIPAGATSAEIPVTILADDEVEPNEDFLVLLTEAEGAAITGPTGRVTIEDADAPDGGGPGDNGGSGGDSGTDGSDGDGAVDGSDRGDGAVASDGELHGAPSGELPATGGGIGLGMVALAALLARRRRD